MGMEINEVATEVCIRGMCYLLRMEFLLNLRMGVQLWYPWAQINVPRVC